MNTYIVIRPYIAQQIMEQLKKLPFHEVCGIIGEINEAMENPIQINWVSSNKSEINPIGFMSYNNDEDDNEEIENKNKR